MIDNREQIKKLLSFADEDAFYFLQVLKRRKDNPEMVVGSKVLKSYYIYTEADYDKCMERAVEVATKENGRVYLRLNRRSAKKTALHFNRRLADLLFAGEYRAVAHLYESAVGEQHSEPEKKWIVDVDETQGLFEPILEMVTKYLKNENVIVDTLKTKNGNHIITKPFRLDLFRQHFPLIDVHKDAPTVVYAP